MKPEGEINIGEITTPVSQLVGHEKRVVSLDYNPIASNGIFQ